MLFDKKMYQVMSSYFPCITRLSRACIPLVCRVLIGSYEDLHKGDPITQVCNQKSETELRQGRVILHNSKYMQQRGIYRNLMQRSKLL